MWIRVTEVGTKHPRLINMNDCTDVHGCTEITRISHALGEYIQVTETVDEVWAQITSFQPAEVQMQSKIGPPVFEPLNLRCELCPPTCGECKGENYKHANGCSRGIPNLTIVGPGRNRCPVHREANL